MERSDFAQMVLEHQGRIRVFIRMLGVVPAAVDDLAQDAFVVAYERRDMLDDPDGAGPWLRAIARNVVRNELRKSARRRRVVNATLTEAMLGESLEGDADTWNDDWLASLRQCKGQLPDYSQRLIDGRYGKGLKAAQLGKDTGKTATAVRQSLTRLRNALRKCIEARLRVEGTG